MKIPTNFLLALVFICQIGKAASATNPADSLKELLYHSHEDSSRIRICAAIAFELLPEKPAEALIYAKRARDIATNISWDQGIALGYNRMGNCFKQLAQYDSAFYFFRKSHLAYLKIKNVDGESVTLMNIGALHQTIGNFDSSVYYLFEALKLAESINDNDQLAAVFNNLGVVMRKEGKIDQAIKYYSRALEIFQSTGNKRSIANTNQNLGVCYAQKKDFVAAKEFYSQALRGFTELNNKRGMGQVSINISSMLEDQKLYRDALSYASRAVQYFREINTPDFESQALLALANIAHDTRENQGAINYALQSLKITIKIGNKKNEQEIYQLLHQLYAETGDFQKAYDYMYKGARLKDSLFNEDKENIISNLQIKYETAKKDEEISLMKKDEELKGEQLNRQKLFKNGFLTLSLLIIVLAFVLYNRFQLRKKLEKTKAVLDERRRISSNMHDDLGSNLSKIALLSEVVMKQPMNEGDKKEIEKISETARESLEKMSEIVWSLNPKNDKLENLLAYIRKFAVEYFDSTSITCKVAMPGEIPDIEMPGEKRREIFLSVKEALQNVLKHSSSSLVELSFLMKASHCEIMIHDNGKGINPENLNRFGNGLQNMKQRMEDIGGFFSIENSDGTSVRLGYKF